MSQSLDAQLQWSNTESIENYVHNWEEYEYEGQEEQGREYGKESGGYIGDIMPQENKNDDETSIGEDEEEL